MAESPQAKLIRRFFSQGQPLAYARGEVILGNWPSAKGIYYIDSGFVKIYSVSDSGDEYVHIVYGHGELFPIIWAYLGVATDMLFYEAMSECTLWRLARTPFLEQLKRDSEFAFAMASQLAQQFLIYSDRVDNLEYKKASERVAYRLLYLAGRFGVKRNGAITIEAPITHELLGNTINLSRENVSRQLEKLEREHVVEQHNHKLVIRDIAALKNKLSRPSNLQNWRL